MSALQRLGGACTAANCTDRSGQSSATLADPCDSGRLDFMATRNALKDGGGRAGTAIWAISGGPNCKELHVSVCVETCGSLLCTHAPPTISGR